MRWMAILLITLSAVAQDGRDEKQLTQARKLEERAVKLLDQGKREQAFDALAKAAEIREKLRTRASTKAKPKKKLPKGVKVRPVDPAGIALTELELALKKGNVKAAQKASVRLRMAMTAQAKRVAALERQLSSLEKQMAEIRRLLGAGKAR